MDGGEITGEGVLTKVAADVSRIRFQMYFHNNVQAACPSAMAPSGPAASFLICVMKTSRTKFHSYRNWGVEWHRQFWGTELTKVPQCHRGHMTVSFN